MITKISMNQQNKAYSNNTQKSPAFKGQASFIQKGAKSYSNFANDCKFFGAILSSLKNIEITGKGALEDDICKFSINCADDANEILDHAAKAFAAKNGFGYSFDPTIEK